MASDAKPGRAAPRQLRRRREMARLRLRVRKRGMRILHVSRLSAQWFVAVTILLTLLLRIVPPPITPLMALRCLEQKQAGKKVRLEKDWIPLEKFSPHIAEAVLAAEDQHFLDHGGFDWHAVENALWENQDGRRKLGASTITQQTAKNLFLWPQRTWFRKGLEAYFTLLLETFWSKRRILEVYLNIVETGDGLYGFEAASRRYFGVSAARADWSQAALLAAVLPNPRKWSPAQPTDYLWRRQEWILIQMDQRGPLRWD